MKNKKNIKKRFKQQDKHHTYHLFVYKNQKCDEFYNSFTKERVDLFLVINNNICKGVEFGVPFHKYGKLYERICS